jgi:hypothetical protein
LLLVHGSILSRVGASGKPGAVQSSTTMSEIRLIENYYAEQSSIIDLLYSRGEVSLAQTAQNLFAKSLLLIAASHFEDRLKDVVISGFAVRSRNDPYINAFFKICGISFQYHAWFDWDRGNANKFYSFFGKEFGEAIKSAIKEDDALSDCVASFVRIGDLRNQIVHNNILVFKLNDTPAQVLERIKKASSFISLVEKVFSVETEPGEKDAA